MHRLSHTLSLSLSRAHPLPLSLSLARSLSIYLSLSLPLSESLFEIFNTVIRKNSTVVAFLGAEPQLSVCLSLSPPPHTPPPSLFFVYLSSVCVCVSPSLSLSLSLSLFLSLSLSHPTPVAFLGAEPQPLSLGAEDCFRQVCVCRQQTRTYGVSTCLVF
jgi:hypothetical protein